MSTLRREADSKTEIGFGPRDLTHSVPNAEDNYVNQHESETPASNNLNRFSQTGDNTDNLAKLSYEGHLNDTASHRFDVHSIDSLIQFGMHYGHQSYSPHREPLVKIILFTLYGVFAVIGLITNLFVVVLLLTVRRRALVNITNLFLLALAVSDVIFCGVSIPVQAVYEIAEVLEPSRTTCRLLFAGFGIPMHFSCLTIMLIAIDRYRIIVYPLKPRMSPGVAVTLIVIIIILSLANSSPIALVTDVYKPILASPLTNGGHMSNESVGHVWPTQWYIEQQRQQQILFQTDSQKNKYKRSYATSINISDFIDNNTNNNSKAFQSLTENHFKNVKKTKTTHENQSAVEASEDESIALLAFLSADRVVDASKNLENLVRHHYCVEHWPTAELRLIFAICLFFIQFAFPLISTSFLYMRIYCRLHERRFRKRDAERKRRTNKILVNIVICFAVCWTPWACYSLFLEIDYYLTSAGQYNMINTPEYTDSRIDHYPTQSSQHTTTDAVLQFLLTLTGNQISKGFTNSTTSYHDSSSKSTLADATMIAQPYYETPTNAYFISKNDSNTEELMKINLNELLPVENASIASRLKMENSVVQTLENHLKTVNFSEHTIRHIMDNIQLSSITSENTSTLVNLISLLSRLRLNDSEDGNLSALANPLQLKSRQTTHGSSSSSQDEFEYNEQLERKRITRILDVILKLFTMGSGCLNPWLYGWLSDSITSILKRLSRSMHGTTSKSRRGKGYLSQMMLQQHQPWYSRFRSTRVKMTDTGNLKDDYLDENNYNSNFKKLAGMDSAFLNNQENSNTGCYRLRVFRCKFCGFYVACQCFGIRSCRKHLGVMVTGTSASIAGIGNIHGVDYIPGSSQKSGTGVQPGLRGSGSLIGLKQSSASRGSQSGSGRNKTSRGSGGAVGAVGSLLASLTQNQHHHQNHQHHLQQQHYNAMMMKIKGGNTAIDQAKGLSSMLTNAVNGAGVAAGGGGSYNAVITGPLPGNSIGGIGVLGTNGAMGAGKNGGQLDVMVSGGIMNHGGIIGDANLLYATANAYCSREAAARSSLARSSATSFATISMFEQSTKRTSLLPSSVVINSPRGSFLCPPQNNFNTSPGQMQNFGDVIVSENAEQPHSCNCPSFTSAFVSYVNRGAVNLPITSGNSLNNSNKFAMHLAAPERHFNQTLLCPATAFGKPIQNAKERDLDDPQQVDKDALNDEFIEDGEGISLLVPTIVLPPWNVQNTAATVTGAGMTLRKASIHSNEADELNSHSGNPAYSRLQPPIANGEPATFRQSEFGNTSQCQSNRLDFSDQQKSSSCSMLIGNTITGFTDEDVSNCNINPTKRCQKIIVKADCESQANNYVLSSKPDGSCKSRCLTPTSRRKSKFQDINDDFSMRYSRPIEKNSSNSLRDVLLSGKQRISILEWLNGDCITAYSNDVDIYGPGCDSNIHNNSGHKSKFNIFSTEECRNNNETNTSTTFGGFTSLDVLNLPYADGVDSLSGVAVESIASSEEYDQLNPNNSSSKENNNNYETSAALNVDSSNIGIEIIVSEYDSPPFFENDKCVLNTESGATTADCEPRAFENLQDKRVPQKHIKSTVTYEEVPIVSQTSKAVKINLRKPDTCLPTGTGSSALGITQTRSSFTATNDARPDVCEQYIVFPSCERPISTRPSVNYLTNNIPSIILEDSSESTRNEKDVICDEDSDTVQVYPTNQKTLNAELCADNQMRQNRRKSTMTTTQITRDLFQMETDNYKSKAPRRSFVINSGLTSSLAKAKSFLAYVIGNKPRRHLLRADTFNNLPEDTQRAESSAINRELARGKSVENEFTNSIQIRPILKSHDSDCSVTDASCVVVGTKELADTCSSKGMFDISKHAYNGLHVRAEYENMKDFQKTGGKLTEQAYNEMQNVIPKDIRNTAGVARQPEHWTIEVPTVMKNESTINRFANLIRVSQRRRSHINEREILPYLTGSRDISKESKIASKHYERPQISSDHENLNKSKQNEVANDESVGSVQSTKIEARGPIVLRDRKYLESLTMKRRHTLKECATDRLKNDQQFAVHSTESFDLDNEYKSVENIEQFLRASSDRKRPSSCRLIPAENRTTNQRHSKTKDDRSTLPEPENYLCTEISAKYVGTEEKSSYEMRAAKPISMTHQINLGRNAKQIESQQIAFGMPELRQSFLNSQQDLHEKAPVISLSSIAAARSSSIPASGICSKRGNFIASTLEQLSEYDARYHQIQHNFTKKLQIRDDTRSNYALDRKEKHLCTTAEDGGVFSLNKSARHSFRRASTGKCNENVMLSPSKRTKKSSWSVKRKNVKNDDRNNSKSCRQKEDNSACRLTDEKRKSFCHTPMSQKTNHDRFTGLADAESKAKKSRYSLEDNGKSDPFERYKDGESDPQNDQDGAATSDVGSNDDLEDDVDKYDDFAHFSRLAAVEARRRKEQNRRVIASLAKNTIQMVNDERRTSAMKVRPAQRQSESLTSGSSLLRQRQKGHIKRQSTNSVTTSATKQSLTTTSSIFSSVAGQLTESLSYNEQLNTCIPDPGATPANPSNICIEYAKSDLTRSSTQRVNKQRLSKSKKGVNETKLCPSKIIHTGLLRTTSRAMRNDFKNVNLEVVLVDDSVGDQLGSEILIPRQKGACISEKEKEFSKVKLNEVQKLQLNSVELTEPVVEQHKKITASRNALTRFDLP